MKSIFKINLYALGVAVLLGVSGCKKVLDVNTDPNNPSTANPEQVLPASQIEMATQIGNDYAFVASSWGQYWTNGTVVGANPIEFFALQGSDIDRSYRNIYARALNDFSVLIKGNQPVFAGMAKIMMAYTMQMLVDLHGDLPFSEALKGEIADGSVIYPKFDKAKDIYDALVPMIKDGITNLQATGVVGGQAVRFPGDEDLIYAGDLAKWTAFANTLMLKIYVRQCQVDPTMLAAANTLMTSPGVTFIDETDPASVYFSGGALGESNPLWARFESRSATKLYYVASETSIRVLDSLSDPRADKLYTPGTLGLDGINQGESNNSPYKATPNTGYAAPSAAHVYKADAPVFLISAWESKFLQAEVFARNDDQANYESALTDAVTASFNYLGASGVTGYLSGRLDPRPNSPIVGLGSSMDERLYILGIQKWISMNGTQMVEGWIETRRFDTPTNHVFTGPGGIFYSPSSNALGAGIFPSLMVYAQTETQYNPNTPARTVTDKVFWDN